MTYRVGRGAVATIGFHPSQAYDLHGVATALLKHLLILGSTAPLAWLDLGGSMVLRMDDPGGAQNVHKRNWAYPKLDETQWAMIGNELRRRRARLSLGYVAGWVDDGDVGRGVLHVAGVAPRRVPGWVYPAPLVRYREHAESGAGPLYNYEVEFRGIQTLRAMGLGDVELHGYTHMYPDSVSWAKAPDRYEATAALAARPAGQHPLALGIAAFRRYFDVRPTTLICPGDEWTDEVLERALDYGLHLMSSYYLALRDGERFCWMTHVCAPYLDEPNPAWFDAGLPVVGYFHDRETALEGVSWIGKWLDQWSDAGAQHLMDVRELAGAIGRRLCFESDQSGLHLRVSGVGAPALVRPLTVMPRAPGKRLPAQLPVCLDSGEVALQIQPRDDGLGRVSLPVTAAGIAS